MDVREHGGAPERLGEHMAEHDGVQCCGGIVYADDDRARRRAGTLLGNRCCIHAVSVVADVAGRNGYFCESGGRIVAPPGGNEGEYPSPQWPSAANLRG